MRTTAAVSSRRLVLWAIAFGGGVYLGYTIAYSATLPGLGPVAALVAGLLAVVILAVLAVVAVLSALRPERRGRSTALAAAVAGGMLAAGVGLGWAITSALGLGTTHPVVLEAHGMATLSLDGLDGYVGQGDALAYCLSIVDGEDVAFVEAGVVGKVKTDFVGASVTVQPGSADGRPVVHVWVQPAVKGEGAAPAWAGAGTAQAPIDGGRDGRLDFSAAALAPSDDGSAPAQGWPTELSGTLSWSCGEWVRSPSTGATPNP